MRKDLRLPPLDVLALRAGLLGGGYYLYAQYVTSGLGPQGLLTRAEGLSGLDLQVRGRVRRGRGRGRGRGRVRA